MNPCEPVTQVKTLILESQVWRHKSSGLVLIAHVCQNCNNIFREISKSRLALNFPLSEHRSHTRCMIGCDPIFQIRKSFVQKSWSKFREPGVFQTGLEWMQIIIYLNWTLKLCTDTAILKEKNKFVQPIHMARGGWCPLEIAGDFPKIVSVLALRVSPIFTGFTHRFFLLLTDSPGCWSYVIKLGRWCPKKYHIFTFKIAFLGF